MGVSARLPVRGPATFVADGSSRERNDDGRTWDLGTQAEKAGRSNNSRQRVLVDGENGVGLGII